MKLFLNTGNRGRPLGDAAIRLLKDHLFDGVRIGIHNGIPVELLDPMMRELADARLEGCFIAGGWDWWDETKGRDDSPPADLVAHDALAIARAAQRAGLKFYIEPGNEPNLAPPKYKTDPRGFARYIGALAMGLGTLAADGIIEPVTVIAGAPSNINPWDGLPYLEAMTDGSLPPGVLVGVHPYRMGSRPTDLFSDRNNGEQSLESVVRRVSLLRPRFAVTEGGWHTAPRQVKRDFPLCFSYREVEGWTDDDVARFSGEELDIWAGAGAEFYVWYQMNDGPNNEQEHRFGIRTIDGGLKPVASALKEWRNR